MTGVWQLLAVSLVVMGLSHTIARERIFAARCAPGWAARTPGWAT